MHFCWLLNFWCMLAWLCTLFWLNVSYKLDSSVFHQDVTRGVVTFRIFGFPCITYFGYFYVLFFSCEMYISCFWGRTNRPYLRIAEHDTRITHLSPPLSMAGAILVASSKIVSGYFGYFVVLSASCNPEKDRLRKSVSGKSLTWLTSHRLQLA